MDGVHCGAALIYGDSASGLGGAPAISPGAFLGLGLHTAFAQVTRHFGAPLGQGDLKTFLGVSSLNSLVQTQPGGGACAYYLNAAKRAARAYQLCFDGSGDLMQKAVITTSGD
jgi:hypothetical protein